jgi:hypothetical protein
VTGISVCTFCKVEPCTCSAFQLPEGTRVYIRGSAAHQEHCEHLRLVDPVSNTCQECWKVLGPSLSEQVAELRERVADLNQVLRALCVVMVGDGPAAPISESYLQTIKDYAWSQKVEKP